MCHGWTLRERLVTAVVINADLRFAAAVDEGADRVVGSRPADVQLCAVPRLDQADEVGALVLETPEEMGSKASQ